MEVSSRAEYAGSQLLRRDSSSLEDDSSVCFLPLRNVMT